MILVDIIILYINIWAHTARTVWAKYELHVVPYGLYTHSMIKVYILAAVETRSFMPAKKEQQACQKSN